MTEGDQPTIVKKEISGGTEAAMLLGAERQAWSEALHESDQLPPDEQAYHKFAIAASKARLELSRGNLEGAVEAAKKVDWSGDTKIYNTIILDLVDKGDIESAIGVIKGLDEAKISQDDRSGIFMSLIKAQALQGDIEGAIATWKQNGPTFTYDHRAPESIAIAQARAGNPAAAEATAIESSHYDIFTDSLNQELARAYAKAGDMAAVDRIVKSYDFVDEDTADARDVNDRGSVITAAAQGLAEHGDIDGALRLANLIKSDDLRAMAYAEVAAVQGSDSPIWIHAKSIAKRFQSPNRWYLGVDNRLAETLIAENKFDKALEIGLNMGEDYIKNHIYLQVAEAQAKAGDLRAMDTIKSVRAMPNRSTGIITEGYANVAAGFQDYLAKHFGSDMPQVPLSELLPRGSGDHRRVGAAALEQWKSFKNYEPATFARLAHGAAEIAHQFMTDEERREFIRNLADEFRQFRDNGMFNDDQHQAVLRHMSEALVELDDPAATGNLLETLNKNMGEATGLRLIKTLLETRNAKAGAAGIAVLCNPETPDHVYEYLMNKLAEAGYIDSSLPATIKDLAYGSNLRLSEVDSRQVLSKFASNLNIQMDSQLLIWVAKKLEEFTASRGNLDYGLNVIIGNARDALHNFEKLDQRDLLNVLSTNEDQRAIYFMLKAGRTKYSLIQHYNLSKFGGAVETAAEIQGRVDPKLIDEGLWENAPQGWKEAMINRRRPDDSLIWQTEVGAASIELRKTAKNEIDNVLGFQLAWLLTGGSKLANLSDNHDLSRIVYRKWQNTGLSGEEISHLAATNVLKYMLGETDAKKISGILGDSITNCLQVDGEFKASVGDFEKAKNALLAQLRQLRNNAKQHDKELASKWKTVISQAEQEDPLYAMRHLLALVANDPELSLHPTGAVAEWTGHVAGMASSVREAQTKGSSHRALTIRYLDGKEDFSELLRFADGAQCCFTSEDTAGVEMDVSGEWRMSINRDPHWFVFSLEDTPPDADIRVSSGFIFGSVAWLDDQPCLALNGVYMQRKTDTAVNTILDEVVDKFATPLGIKQILVGSQFGGEFKPDKNKWRPAAGRTLFRPRAIRSDYGPPERRIYDDLGQVVNGHATVSEKSWVRVM